MPTHLAPSQLGQKEYWDELYARELHNHQASTTTIDEGTIWFEEAHAEQHVARLLDQLASLPTTSTSNVPTSHTVTSVTKAAPLNKQTATILDVGTGNGSMLRTLRARGWAGDMLGIDYAEAGVRLAEAVQERWLRRLRRGKGADDAGEKGEEVEEPGKDKEEEEEEEADDDDDDDETVNREPLCSKPARFLTWDLFSTSSSETAAIPVELVPHREVNGVDTHADEGWDLVLDKGTFDAISLSTRTDAQGRRLTEVYRERIVALLRKDGLAGRFVITSCNWTEDELRAWFETTRAHDSKGGLRFETRVEYPCFSFGGVKGQAVSTVCFIRDG